MKRLVEVNIVNFELYSLQFLNGFFAYLEIDECDEFQQCSQICEVFNKTVQPLRCSCVAGYRLDKDHRTCKAIGVYNYCKYL